VPPCRPVCALVRLNGIGGCHSRQHFRATLRPKTCSPTPSATRPAPLDAAIQTAMAAGAARQASAGHAREGRGLSGVPGTRRLNRQHFRPTYHDR
jgi:hypothetical protein